MTKSLICLLVFGLAGCQYPKHENVFVLPNGYVGPLLVILVEGSPQAYVKHEHVNTYTFPKSGVICVATFDNFTKGWGVTNAEYADGTAIRSSYGPAFDDIGFEVIGLSGSSSRSFADGSEEILSDPEIFAVVGSFAEIRSASLAWSGSAEKPKFRRDLCSAP